MGKVKKNKRKRQKTAKLNGGQRVYLCFALTMLFCCISLTGLCLFFGHITESIIVFSVIIVLVLVLSELVRADRIANRYVLAARLGLTKMAIRDVTFLWSDKSEDYGDVLLRERGIVIDGDFAYDFYKWRDVLDYKKLNGNVVEIQFGEYGNCKIPCGSDIRMLAVEQMLDAKTHKDLKALAKKKA